MACAREHVLGELARLAPLELSESWDNTGLLVDPGDRREFVRAILTIDLTEAVLDEADELGVDLVVAYHPPIFRGLTRLRAGAPGEGLIVRALRAGQSIYSPHTALDSVPGGMTEWLAGALGPGTMEPIVPHPSFPGAGAGRLVDLAHPVSIEEAVARIKTHLGIASLRIARGKKAIRRLAVCPGAGGSVFEKVGSVDLLLTGEMRHHDVLARAARGTSVILTDHTNTERGYLLLLADKLRAGCPGLSVSVSRSDADPLVVV
jgi:dinuclear metal center YbgI/SA1388 family protein